MISDKQRREVAARLRSKKPEEFAAPFGRHVFAHIFSSVFPNQMLLSNWILRLPYQLADLIDPPTTTYICEQCGGEWPSDIMFERCPYCGTVIDDD